jgi:hypothetical protein
MDIDDQFSLTAEGILRTYGGSVAFQGTHEMGIGRGKPFLFMSPEHVPLFTQAEMSKDAIKMELWKRGSLPVSQFPDELQQRFKASGRPVYDGRVRLTAEASDFSIVVMGGLGPHSLFLTGMGQYKINRIER